MMLDGLDSKSGRDMRFSSARATDKDNVLRPIHKLASVQLAHDLPVIDRQVLKPFPFDVIARVPEEEERLFCGPRILWPDGTNPAKGINAIYADAPFTFQHSLGVLSAPNDEIGRLTARFITCYMRSTLGSWLSILLSASVSAERAKLHKAELADWPFWSLSDHPDRPRAERVLHEVDAVMASIETTGILSAPAAYAALVERLNELVFDYFGINKGERATIIELARVIGPSIQPAGLGYKSMVKPLRSQPDATILAKYAERLLAEMARWRDATGGQGDLAATIWTARRVPLGAAILQIVHDDDVHPQPRVADDDILEEIGAALVRVAGRADAGLFRIPNLTIIDGRRILIIKPLVARYWLERSSVADAARIAVELQAAQLFKKEIVNVVPNNVLDITIVLPAALAALLHNPTDLQRDVDSQFGVTKTRLFQITLRQPPESLASFPIAGRD